MVERANRTVREETDSRLMLNYQDAVNSKIALIEKMAYGFRNRGHLKTAIYFKCGNLDLYP